MYKRVLFFVAIATAPFFSTTSFAQSAGDIQVDFTNVGNADFALTPLWFAFQNGNFDFFDVGQASSPALELLAEDGVVSGLQDDFTAAGQPGNIQGVVTAPGGFAGAPVVEPGETGTAFVTPINPANYQFFSFASMLIPTNDTFIGNDSAMAYQVFDSMGNINDPSGTFTINIFASDLYESGTEDNTGLGAPFSAAGGTATDTVGGLIGPAGDLQEFAGVGTPAGFTVNEFFAADALVATISVSVVP